jgi:adenylate cyclase
VVADLCGFGALTDTRGDHVAATVALRFTAVARLAFGRRVRIVNTMGDAVLAVAATDADALAGARRLVSAVAADPGLPPVHVGLATGPVVWRRGDVFGATVNRAARLAEEAEPGEIRTDGAGVTRVPVLASLRDH